MNSEREPWRIVPAGLRLRVRLTPKSTRDAIDGVEQTAEGPAVKARVRAVPEDGAANAAAARLIADWLGVAKSTVSLAGGAKSRVKMLEVAGDGAALAGAAEMRLASLSEGRKTPDA